MTASVAFTALAILCLTGWATWRILKGWRTSEDAGNTRRKASREGQAFADATIVLTVMSIVDKLAQEPGKGQLPVLPLQLIGGFGMLVALFFLPHLARPLLALVAGVFVSLSFGFPMSILLMAAYLIVAVLLSWIKR